MDDAAVLGDLVLTHDMLAEGVHFLTRDPPADVAWKLLAVNLSDLAAKGATPLGALMGYSLGDDDAWDAAFVAGLGVALAHFDVPLLGGDTVALPPGTPRVLGMTLLGRSQNAPSRSGAVAGDALWVTGEIGGAGLGLEIAKQCAPAQAGAQLSRPGATVLLPAQEHMLTLYRRPQPRLAEGQALAPLVHALMDVSDGLLLDASRMAEASGLALAIDLDAVPLFEGAALMAAIVAGDDYELLFAAPADFALPVPATRIGAFAPGAGLTLHDHDGAVALPERLGYLHGG